MGAKIIRKYCQNKLGRADYYTNVIDWPPTGQSSTIAFATCKPSPAYSSIQLIKVI